MSEALKIMERGEGTPVTYEIWDGQRCTFASACRRLGLHADGLRKVAERYQAKARERELRACEAELVAFLCLIGFEQESAKMAAAELLKSGSTVGNPELIENL